MRRALHIGLFIGTLLGMSACAAVERTAVVAPGVAASH
jgi:hypothetical protein